MNTGLIIGIIIVAVGGLLFVLLRKDKKEAAPKSTYKPSPVVIPEPVKPTPIKDPPTPVYPEPAAPVEPTPTEPVAGPIPAAPTPKGTNPDALYQFTVARQTKVIDLSKFRNLGERTLGDNSMARVPNAVFRFEGNPSFGASIAKTSLFNKSVLYLCDKTGKVHGFCISAAGAKQAERAIAYESGSIEGGAYLVQASDGSHSGAQYYSIRK